MFPSDSHELHPSGYSLRHPQRHPSVLPVPESSTHGRHPIDPRFSGSVNSPAISFENDEHYGAQEPLGSPWLANSQSYNEYGHQAPTPQPPPLQPGFTSFGGYHQPPPTPIPFDQPPGLLHSPTRIMSESHQPSCQLYDPTAVGPLEVRSAPASMGKRDGLSGDSSRLVGNTAPRVTINSDGRHTSPPYPMTSPPAAGQQPKLALGDKTGEGKTNICSQLAAAFGRCFGGGDKKIQKELDDLRAQVHMYHEQLEQARVSQSSQGGETSRLAANSTIRATPNSNPSHSANASAANGAGIKSFPPGLGFDKSKSAMDIEKVQIDPIKRTSPGECRNLLMIFNNVLSSVNLNAAAYGGPSTEADQRNICRLTMRWVAKDSEIVTDIRTWFGENPSEGTRVLNHVVEVFINASVRESAEAEKAILEFDWDGMVSKDGDFTRTKLNELWALISLLLPTRQGDQAYWISHVLDKIQPLLTLEFDFQVRKVSSQNQRAATTSYVFVKYFSMAVDSWHRKASDKSGIINAHQSMGLSVHEKMPDCCNFHYCPKMKSKGKDQCDLYGTPTQDRIDYISKEHTKYFGHLLDNRKNAGKPLLVPSCKPAPAPASNSHQLDAGLKDEEGLQTLMQTYADDAEDITNDLHDWPDFYRQLADKALKEHETDETEQ